jgi:uncharacterized HAD superfamily protein
MNAPLTRIAIDIDDVIADTLGAVHIWANAKAGASFELHHYHTDDEYWDYYNNIWARHGFEGKLVFEDFLDEMIVDQSNIRPNDDAKRVIKALMKKYEVVFLTARPPAVQEETRKWLDKNIDTSIPLYLACNPILNETALSKGEMCNELGVGLLIDDNIDNCNSALDHEVEAIVYGHYGWNKNAPDSMTRCLNWAAVLEQVNGR